MLDPKALAKITAEAVKKHVRPLDQRIATLEAEVTLLKATSDLERRLAKLEGKRK